MKKEVLERLETFPQKIFEKEVELLQKVDDLDELKLKIGLLELQVYNKVMEEVDEEGKKLFSNKEKRDVETKSRLDKLVDFGEMSKGIKNLRKDIDTDKLLVSFLKRKFRSAECFVKGGEE